MGYVGVTRCRPPDAGGDHPLRSSNRKLAGRAPIAARSSIACPGISEVLALGVSSQNRPPSADGLSDSLGGLVADSQHKFREPLAIATSGFARPECITEEVQRDMFMFLPSIAVFAINDPCFLLMEFMTAFSTTSSNCLHDVLSFVFGSAVDNRIVRVSFKTQMRECPLHPKVECIVQNQIGAHRGDHRALRVRWRFGRGRCDRR